MTTTAPPIPAPRTSRRAAPVALALAAASLPMFMSTLDNLVMTSALPVIQRALSASVEQLSAELTAVKSDRDRLAAELTASRAKLKEITTERNQLRAYAPRR